LAPCLKFSFCFSSAAFLTQVSGPGSLNASSEFQRKSNAPLRFCRYPLCRRIFAGIGAAAVCFSLLISTTTKTGHPTDVRFCCAFF
jgi:hypothetical protein